MGQKKKKIVMCVMYVIPHISNRILDFFFENYPGIENNATSSYSVEKIFINKNLPTTI